MWVKDVILIVLPVLMAVVPNTKLKPDVLPILPSNSTVVLSLLRVLNQLAVPVLTATLLVSAWAVMTPFIASAKAGDANRNVTRILPVATVSAVAG